MRYDSYLEAAYSYPKDLSQKHHLFVPIAALRAAAPLPSARQRSCEELWWVDNWLAAVEILALALATGHYKGKKGCTHTAVHTRPLQDPPPI